MTRAKRFLAIVGIWVAVVFSASFTLGGEKVTGSLDSMAGAPVEAVEYYQPAEVARYYQPTISTYEVQPTQVHGYYQNTQPVQEVGGDFQ